MDMPDREYINMCILLVIDQTNCPPAVALDNLIKYDFDVVMAITMISQSMMISQSIMMTVQ